MSSVPTVGVVVAARNVQATIGDALASVLAQDPVPVDVVVVDGASTDGTADIAAHFDGVRVVAQRGAGLGAARNQALHDVRGELIAFCDGDDTWTDGSLAARVAHLAADERCDAVVGRVVTAPAPGESVPARHDETVGVPRPGNTPGALLARRSVFECVGPFDEALRIGSDSDWFVRLRESACRVDRIDAVVLVKGLRAASLSNDITMYRRELLDVARAYVNRQRDRGGT